MAKTDRRLTAMSWVKKFMKQKMWDLLKEDRHMYLYYRSKPLPKNANVYDLNYEGGYWGERTHEYYAKQLKDIWNFDWRECTTGTSYEIEGMHLICKRNKKLKRSYTHKKGGENYVVNGDQFNLFHLSEGRYIPEERFKNKSDLINEAVLFFEEVFFNYEIPEFNLI